MCGRLDRCGVSLIVCGRSWTFERGPFRSRECCRDDIAGLRVYCIMYLSLYEFIWTLRAE